MIFPRFPSGPNRLLPVFEGSFFRPLGNGISYFVTRKARKEYRAKENGNLRSKNCEEKKKRKNLPSFLFPYKAA